MSNKNKHVVTGYISYSDEIQYKWITEAGKNTCDKCKSLNGKIFDKDNLPKRPHPNCRCRVEEISIVDNNTAKFYGYRDEKLNLQISAQEILGDINRLKAKVHKELDKSEYQEIIEKKEILLHDILILEEEVNQFINEILDLNRYSKNELFNNKSMELINLSSKCSRLFDQSEYLRLRQMQIKWDKKIYHYEHPFSSEDAGAIWKLASSKFTDKEGLDYIKRNGYIVNKISDIHDSDLEKFIKNKLDTQNFKSKNVRGIMLNENSSLAYDFSHTKLFWDFLISNIETLEKNRKLQNTSLNFHALNSSVNAHLAVHRADIIDIYLDDNDIIHLKIVDTVDYNLGEKEVEELRELQENGFLENYYVIVKIAIPLSECRRNIDIYKDIYYNNYEMYPRSTNY